jgi:hypothetical protein
MTEAMIINDGANRDCGQAIFGNDGTEPPTGTTEFSISQATNVASWYIALPIVRIETSQKAQRGVHLTDLAAYIDKRRAAAIKECLQLAGTI